MWGSGTFLREDLQRRSVVTCAEAMAARDGRWIETAGLDLVRQMSGSAKGVMFSTIEDAAGAAPQVIDRSEGPVGAYGDDPRRVGVGQAAHHALAESDCEGVVAVGRLQRAVPIARR